MGYSEEYRHYIVGRSHSVSCTVPVANPSRLGKHMLAQRARYRYLASLQCRARARQDACGESLVRPPRDPAETWPRRLLTSTRLVASMTSAWTARQAGARILARGLAIVTSPLAYTAFDTHACGWT